MKILKKEYKQRQYHSETQTQETRTTASTATTTTTVRTSSLHQRKETLQDNDFKLHERPSILDRATIAEANEAEAEVDAAGTRSIAIILSKYRTQFAMLFYFVII